MPSFFNLYAPSVFRIRTTGLRIQDLDPVPDVYFSGFLQENPSDQKSHNWAPLSKGISVFKDNKLLRSHKTVEIKVFKKCFCLLMEGSAA
jgi:hypothetical protein